MNFKEIAKDYSSAFGFNLLPLENKVPKISAGGGWEKWQSTQMLLDDIDLLGWHSPINGIGAISGINKLRCLDFDNVPDYDFIKSFLIKLGFPLEYLWTVKSGSGKGYHIWFYCDDASFLFDTLGGEKSYYKLRTVDSSLCDHIELRWKNCQTVLPPSYHPSGKQYEFINVRDGIPSSPPQNIGAGKLVDTIKHFCALNTSAANTNPELRENKKCSGGINIDQKEGVECECNLTTVKKAAEFLSGGINNYDDFLRIGFALASIGESGREFFLMIGKDNPKYPGDSEAALNKKFDGLLKDYRGDITLGSFFDIAKKYGFKFPKENIVRQAAREYGIWNMGENRNKKYLDTESIDLNSNSIGRSHGEFWRIKDGKAVIIRNQLIGFLENRGFAKMFLGTDYIFVRITHNIVKEVTPVLIKDFILDYINANLEEHIKKLLIESLIANARSFFCTDSLEFLKTADVNFIEDTKDKAMFFFNNCLIEVMKDSVEIKNYNQLNGYIWEEQLNKRDFSSSSSISDFETCINNICLNNGQRIISLKTAIGYLLHAYKDPSCAKAIIFIDEKLSDSAFGRSGKGLISKGISQVKNMLRFDGKNFKFDKSFPFQSVNPDTQIIFFDDVAKKFGFEKLFSIITEGLTIEKKNKNEYSIPFEKAPKLLITTNHSITGSDDSSKDRQFVIEFSDFYNANHKPKDDFGNLFFSDWNKDQWSAFDNFMIDCCRLYLNKGLTEYRYINLDRKKLIDETSPEFEEFIKEIPLDVEHNKKELFERFKKEYEDFGQIKQNTLTKWTKVYAQLYELRIEERKSGVDRFIIFQNKSRLGQVDKHGTKVNDDFFQEII
ncbi:MAG: bifunctional DNA primase/polymerase [Ignavibacteriaceae bacterium]